VVTDQTQSYTTDSWVPLTGEMLEGVKYTIPAWTYTGDDNKTARVPGLAGIDSVVFGLYGPVTSPATTLPATPVITSEAFTVTQLKEAGVITGNVNDGPRLTLAKGLTVAQLAALDNLLPGDYTITMTVTKAGYTPLNATFGLTWAVNWAVDPVAGTTDQTSAWPTDTNPVTKDAFLDLTWDVPTWSCTPAGATAPITLDLVDTDQVVLGLYADPTGNPLVESASYTVAQLKQYGVLVDPNVADDQGGDTVGSSEEEPTTPASPQPLQLVPAAGLWSSQLTVIELLPSGTYTVRMTATKPGYGPMVATFPLKWTHEGVEMQVPEIANTESQSYAVTGEGNNTLENLTADDLLGITYEVPQWKDIFGKAVDPETEDTVDFEIWLATEPEPAGTEESSEPTPAVTAGPYTIGELVAACVLQNAGNATTCNPVEPAVDASDSVDTAPEVPDVYTFVPAKGLDEPGMTQLKALPSGDYIIKMIITKNASPGGSQTSETPVTYAPLIATFQFSWAVPATPK
jgi:hypothetical protein